MVEITSEEHNKVKRMKRTEDSLRHLWDNIKCTNLNYRGPRRKRKKKGKAEKYYTSEGTKYKHRSPNKWRGNSQTTWKRIQNNESKDDQNLENKMEKIQISTNKAL